MKHALWIFYLGVCFAADTPSAPTNKLLMMHRFYYLPFSIGFEQGRSVDEIIPLIEATGQAPSPAEFNMVNQMWTATREEWFKSSLLLNTPLNPNQSARISGHLASHRITLDRKPFDGLTLAEQIQIKQLLQDKPDALKRSFTQIRFLRSLLNEHDNARNVFFIVGASWCQSSRTYRALTESYLKKFPLSDLTVHSIVIDDPSNQIFDSALMGWLFPNSAQYSHDTIPRFLFFENSLDKPVLYEEGHALSQLLDRYFYKHHGFLNSQLPFLKPKARGLTGGWQTK